MWGEDYEKDKYIGYPGYIGHCCRVYLCDDSGLVDMKNSFLEGYNSVNVHSGTPQPEYSGLFDKVYVDVRPLETTAVDSLTNRCR